MRAGRAGRPLDAVPPAAAACGAERAGLRRLRGARRGHGRVKGIGAVRNRVVEGITVQPVREARPRSVPPARKRG